MKRGPVIATAIALLGAGAFATDLQPVPIDDVDGDQRSDLVVASSSLGRQLMAVSSRGDHALWIFSPRENYAHGLPVVVTCVDRDGDQARDLAVAWTSQAVDDIPEHVLVAIHSSRTGRVLAWTRIPCADSEMALSLIEAGDLDGDSRPEILLGISGFAGGIGAVHALSGADLESCELVRGERPDGRFGSAIEPLGDLDGDGVDDFAIGQPGTSRWTSGSAVPGQRSVCGIIRVVSGRSGLVLHDIRGTDLLTSPMPDFLWEFGHSFAVARAPDAQASANLWVVVPANQGASTEVLLLAPRTGEVLERVAVADIELWDMLYLRLASAGDWDGDRSGDVLLSDPQWNRLAPGSEFVSDIGHVRIVGARGELARWEGERAHDQVGCSVAVAGVEGAGTRPDIWISAYAAGDTQSLTLYAHDTTKVLRRFVPSRFQVCGR